MSERRKFKMQRTLGIELPGLGKPGALEKNPTPPGQHGAARKKKPTEYGLQLHEKQKVLFHYGLREEQLRRFVRDARRISPSNWIEALISLLERRIDNLVFRAGFGRSIASARQLVSHGHVLVNGKRLTIGSAVLRAGDTLELTEYAKGAMTEVSRSSPRLPLPEFLQFAEPNDNTRAKLVTLPAARHIPFAFEPQRVAEYYAQRGV